MRLLQPLNTAFPDRNLRVTYPTPLGTINKNSHGLCLEIFGNAIPLQLLGDIPRLFEKMRPIGQRRIQEEARYSLDSFE